MGVVSRAQPLKNFLRFRKPALVMLGKDPPTIHLHVEHPPRTLDQLHLGTQALL